VFAIVTGVFVISLFAHSLLLVIFSMILCGLIP
jgi:hypothetical protein